MMSNHSSAAPIELLITAFRAAASRSGVTWGWWWSWLSFVSGGGLSQWDE